MFVGRVALLAVGRAALAEAQSHPHLGETCIGCMCGKVDLSSFSGREFHTQADDDGYVYMFQMCEEIPSHRLPEGCLPQPGAPALPHPAVVKFKDNNPLDCELVGSFGPCEGGIDCGMTYLPPSDGKAFSVTWRYQYGCEDTFRIFLTHGHQTQPQGSPYNDPDDPYDCFWVLHWPSLDAFGVDPVLKPGDESNAGKHLDHYGSLLLRLLSLLSILFVLLVTLPLCCRRKRGGQDGGETIYDTTSGSTEVR